MLINLFVFLLEVILQYNCALCSCKLWPYFTKLCVKLLIYIRSIVLFILSKEWNSVENLTSHRNI